MNITQNDIIPVFYKDLESLLYRNIEIKNNVIFLNFILKELYIKIKYEYTIKDLNNIFNNTFLSDNEQELKNKLKNKSKNKGKIYELDNND